MTRPMLECHLHAPTISGLSESSPTLTNLDCETVYQLTLRKLADEHDEQSKLNEDRLLVSIRLAINSDHLPEGLTERDLFDKWKSLHPNGRLFSVEYGGLSNGSNGASNQLHYVENIDDKSEPVDVVAFNWSRDNEVQLDICFHCVSSQFPFKLGPRGTDMQFVFNVNVSSLNVPSLVYYFVCQIKIYWPSRTEKANLRTDLHTQKSQPDVPNKPSGDYTVLTQLDGALSTNTSCIITIQKDEPTTLPEDYTEVESGLEKTRFKFLDYLDAGFAFITKSQDYFVYAPNYNRQSYVDVNYKKENSQIARFRGFFYHKSDPFTIELQQNSSNRTTLASVRNGLLVKTTILLQLNERDLDDIEIVNWSFLANRQISMLQLDFNESKFLDAIQDIRQVKTNCIEIYWIPPKEFSLNLTFKINCLSAEFASRGNNSLDEQFGPALSLSISSIQLKTNTVLETINCQLYSINRVHSLEEAKSNWLKQNMTRIEANKSLNNILLFNRNISGVTHYHYFKFLLDISALLIVSYFSYTKLQSWFSSARGRVRFNKEQIARETRKNASTAMGLKNFKIVNID